MMQDAILHNHTLWGLSLVPYDCNPADAGQIAKPHSQTQNREAGRAGTTKSRLMQDQSCTQATHP